MNRERAKELLRKLRAIKIEAGATTAEAALAAERARAIAEAHGIDLDALDVDEAAVRGRFSRWRPRDYLVVAIADFAGCASYTEIGQVRSGRYIGQPHRVALAVWLHEMLNGHIERALTAFRATPSYRRRRQKNRNAAAFAFEDGMVDELYWLLFHMTDRTAATTARNELAPYMAAHHANLTVMDIPETKRDGRLRLDDAAHLGRQAAKDVAISTPVEGGAATRLIGGN